jgi:hypothetical protein
MPKMNQSDAEHLISYIRTAVNQTYADKSKSKVFDPEDHNLCFAYCTFSNPAYPPVCLISFSAMSNLTQAVKTHLTSVWRVEFVPDVSNSLKFYACGGMGKYHTEPRLINFLFCSPGHLENLQDITLVSEIDCCRTCVKYTIDTFAKKHQHISVHTIELGKIPSAGILPQFTVPYLNS